MLMVSPGCDLAHMYLWADGVQDLLSPNIPNLGMLSIVAEGV